MPAKNSSLQNGDRYNPICRATWEKFQVDSGLAIDYSAWVKIIHAGNERYAYQIQNNATGVKFPEYMGHAGTTRYKPKAGTRRIDWKNTNRLGKHVYYTNFHSEGYESRIVWLVDEETTCRYLGVYKMVPDRKLSRGTAPLIRGGKIYNELNHEHFRMGKIRVNISKHGYL